MANRKESQNALAKHFKSLHQPGNPIVLTNVWDAATASSAIAHPSTKAVATASFAIAGSIGTTDSALTLPENLTRVKLIAPVVAAAKLPLTVDLQDGYDDIASTIAQVIDLGAVGCNIEDVANAPSGEGEAGGKLRSLEDAVDRIRVAKEAAVKAGVPDFVINARTDVLFLQPGANVQDAVDRGQAFLRAGATTVYVWGGPMKRGVSRKEVQDLVQGLGGMMNVKQNFGDGVLKTRELRELGVARVSVGPELYFKAMEGFRKGLEGMLEGYDE